MRKKYENKSFVMKMFHKYTGFIVMGIIAAIAVPIYLDYETNKEFFHSFSCQDVYDYMMGASFGYTPHNELTEEQHMKLHKIYDNCLTNEKFSPRIEGH